MGNQPPAPDARLQEVIDTFELTPDHIAKFWKLFQKYDRDRSGTIDTKEFYNLVHEPQSVYADSIFELIEAENEGQLDFSEFVKSVCTYCMFGKDDILRFCFYIFDKDKNGYIEEDEMHALVQMLHQNSMSANLKLSLDRLDTNKDGRVDFKEFQQMNASYPQILFPAFRMQSNMMMYTLGTSFWMDRRAHMHDKRLAAQAKSDRLKRLENQRMEAIQNREIKRRMGTCRYYFCACQREDYMVKVHPEKGGSGKKYKSSESKRDLDIAPGTPGSEMDREKREKRKKKKADASSVSDSSERDAHKAERKKRREKN